MAPRLVTYPPGTSLEHYIYPWHPHRFRERFKQALANLLVTELGFRPYSIRRGGATSFYRASANLNAIVERGRWAHVRVARIYICDGLGVETEMRIPAAAQRIISYHAFDLLQTLKPQ